LRTACVYPLRMPYVYLSHIRSQLGPTRLSYFLRRLDNISTVYIDAVEASQLLAVKAIDHIIIASALGTLDTCPIRLSSTLLLQ